MSGYFIVWLVATAADAVGLVLAFLYMLSLRERFGNYLAVLIAGVTFEACLAALFWPAEVEVSKAFAVTRGVGRVAEMLAVWVFVLYRIGFFNGVRKPPTAEGG